MRRKYFDLDPGQTVEVGNSLVTLEQKTGRRARLRIESNETVQLQRERAPDIQRAQPQATPLPAGYAGLQPPLRSAG